MNTNDSFNQTKTVTARIVSVHKNRFQIALDSAERKAAEHDAVLAGRLLYRGEIPVVGDYIEAEFETSPVGKPVGDARIVSILPRKSLITRPEYRVGTQNMAANVDICFLVVSANADFSVNRIARYASAVLQGGSKPVVVLTKADLCSDLSEYTRRISEICGNIQMHCVSSKTEVGIDELRQYLVPGTTIGLFGSSGVGKSTLINTLLGREIMRTGDIREKDDKGRHTTTHRQLIEADGVFLVDTPGMREFGICKAEEGLHEVFRDIEEKARQCRFRNCTHKNEPGCAVRQAIEDGVLSQKQYDLYLALQAENSVRTASEKRAQKNKKMIGISKKRKELRNNH